MASAADEEYLAGLRTYRTLLTTRRNQAMGAPKPTYTDNGVTYDWAGYLTFLSNEIDKINKQISEAEGPFEICSFAE